MCPGGRLPRHGHCAQLADGREGILNETGAWGICSYHCNHLRGPRHSRGKGGPWCSANETDILAFDRLCSASSDQGIPEHRMDYCFQGDDANHMTVLEVVVPAWLVTVQR